jgi:hypothetical protein
MKEVNNLFMDNYKQLKKEIEEHYRRRKDAHGLVAAV